MNNFFSSLTKIQKILLSVIVGVIVFVVTTLISYSLFSGGRGASGSLSSSLPTPNGALVEDPKAPKTEACPLNGTLHTKEARASWEQRRPLAVMIENHTEARPQSGISSADVVYETVAEGGITRFMSLFYCNLGDIQVGPVRSARTYFLDWLSEYDALYAHVGGANTSGPADALGQIITYNIKDLNQFSIGFPTFWRDYDRLGHPVATEHTMYSTTQKLWAVGAQRGWTATDSSTNKKWADSFVPWQFKDGQPGTGATASIHVPFWSNSDGYQVDWSYDKNCNCYHRKNGGADHIDFDNKQVLSPVNVVVQFEVESHAHDGYENDVHLLYGDKGQGRALIFQNGQVIEGTWNKATRLAREKFLDQNGKEISFVRGQIWIQTVPEGNKVTF